MEAQGLVERIRNRGSRVRVVTVQEAVAITECRMVLEGLRAAPGRRRRAVIGWPGDNLVIHAAVERCDEGDILVVTTTSPCMDGLFGELFATALQQRGVRGVVLNTGVRDTQELREMGFAAWSRAVCAQGTVRA